MEKGLLEKDGEAEEKTSLGHLGLTWSVLSREVKEVGSMAAPMVAVNMSQYFLQIISLTMVGHLGELALSSTAISTSLCAVSGYSVVATKARERIFQRTEENRLS